MKKSEIEHIIKAAASISEQNEVLIVGSQSILASFNEEDLPKEATMSIEADIIIMNDNNGELTDLVDGTIGEFSPFHEMFGIYAQGVDFTTSILPEGWRDRLVKLQNANTGNAIGYCLDPYDLCVAKLMAHREKDLEYVNSVINSGLLLKEEIISRISLIKENYEKVKLALDFLK